MTKVVTKILQLLDQEVHSLFLQTRSLHGQTFFPMGSWLSHNKQFKTNKNLAFLITGFCGFKKGDKETTENNESYKV